MTGVENIWFQVGMVGAFIAFAITILRIQVKERADLMTVHLAERESNDVRWKEFVRERDAEFNQTLEAMRQQRLEAMTHAYGMMEKLITSVGELSRAMANHDVNAQKRQSEVMAALIRIELLLDDGKRPTRKTKSKEA
jgi:hypothetical protein